MVNGARVYLIDDDRIFSVIAQVLLRKIYPNIIVECFCCGEDALQQLLSCGGELRPDILFLDINMPMMDGWEFLEKLQQIEQVVTPVCLTSSSIDPQDQMKASAHPRVIGFMEKPFQEASVKDLIEAVIG